MESKPLLDISKEQLEHILNPDVVLRELLSEKQVAEQLKLDPEDLAIMYRHALELFKKEHYQDAAYAFFFLSFLDNTNFDIWIGLGMSLQMTQHYEAAIIAYELAAVREIENPIPYFYLAKCLFAIHDHKAALEAIEMAIEYSEDQPKFAEILEQSRTAKASLLRRQA
ncbi:MAG: SycD/LcrH family type III secretion system chaperone [Parachlamydiales bacterium]|jgi:type III secretion system low calcium response chaperone LcrH/SycD